MTVKIVKTQNGQEVHVEGKKLGLIVDARDLGKVKFITNDGKSGKPGFYGTVIKQVKEQVL